MTSKAMEPAPYRDAATPVLQRASDLLKRMTRAEKIAQLGSAWVAQLSDGEKFEAEKARSVAPHGIGQVTRISGSTLLGPDSAARLANDIQRWLVEETRLGVPAIVHEEALHGLTALGAVVHPGSINMASTWDPALVREMGAYIGRAARLRGAHLLLSPILDITRDPRWGRLEETYGEDAYLVTAMGIAHTLGIQGEGVLGCGKHLVGHGVPEGGMNRAPAHIGARELREQFLLPFEAAVREAGLATVMHAYDELDGLPCVANHELLTHVLREEWGFDGLVVSDYDGVVELITAHQLTLDPVVAAAMALNAGLDQELPRTSVFAEPIEEALERDLVTQEALDAAVTRVLRTKFELGLFDRPYVNIEAATVDLGSERAHALRIARDSVILLANDGLLPLAPDITRLAVIGPSADDPRNYIGDYAHQVHVDTLLRGTDSIAERIEVPSGLRPTHASDAYRTVLAELHDRYPTAALTHVRGCGLLDGDDEEIAAAAAAAAAADVAVLVVGERSALTDDGLTGETSDRLDIGLPGRQQELLEAVVATGTPTVLVLIAGRPLAIPWASDHCAAIVHAWLPGERGAEAIADVLTGVVNPGGKLPVTVPRHVGQVPIYYAHRPTGGHTNWKVEYVDGSNLPLWPFGHGLSYTTFALSDLRLDTGEIDPSEEVVASVEVTNTGDRAGDEVVQLYVRDVEASLTRPVKELRGFKRVRLEPGQRRTVSFTLAAEQLSFVDVPGRWVVEPGVFRLMVGTSSADLPLHTELTVSGEALHIDSRSRYLTSVTVR